jgi:uncharacterized protein with NRDE domain
MCVLAIALGLDERWPLVLIGNRDEFHARPSAPLSRWPDQPILAGRDLLSGGTWLGVTEGRLAVVTNVATGRLATDLSRGILVPHFLQTGGYPEMDGMNPFNLLTFDSRGGEFVSNHPEAVRRQLDPGLYALANGALDQRLFRTDRLKDAIARWLVGDRREPEALLASLADQATSDASGLAEARSNTPKSDAVPVFIMDPVYGTRCSTLVAIDAEGQGRIVERRFDPDGSVSGETRLDFKWPDQAAVAGVRPGPGASR